MNSANSFTFCRLIANAILALQKLQDALSPQNTTLSKISFHDGQIHDPLGAGSYMFQNAFIPSIIRSIGLPIHPNQCGALPQSLIIHIGAQPNNSPHVGTLVVFFMAFILAREIKLYHLSCHDGSEEVVDWMRKFRVKVRLNLVDTAPDPSHDLQYEGIAGKFQRSLRSTEGVLRFQADYDEALKLASQGVEDSLNFEIMTQEDLTRMKCMPGIIERIVKNRHQLGPLLAPDKEVLAMRAACPQCDVADKHGIHNTYTIHPTFVIISFLCPVHGRHEISTLNVDEVARLEFNTPLRNLVRSIALALHTAESRQEGKEGALHIRVTGMDYAGYYTDQMFWRAWLMLGLDENLIPPVVLYAPLIVDWAGSKISKSLYVKHGAYEYLNERGMDYLLSFAEMKKRKDPLILFRLVESWVKEPKKLFRTFSIEYLHMKFSEEEDAPL